MIYIMWAIYFVIASFIAFYIPGNLLLRSFKLSPVVKTSSSILLGMSMWALQGFILGYLNLRFMTYIYLILMTLLWIKINYPKFPKYKKLKVDSKTIKENLVLTTIFITGVGLQILSVIGNAIPLKNGLYFCCGGADAIYHGALVKELVSNFPPNEPGIANQVLHNYHFLSNLIIAELIRIFNLPLLQTEFIFIPIFMSIMFGLSLYSVANQLKISKNFTIFFLILGFFFSDTFYLLTFASKKTLAFNVETIEIATSLWASYTRYFGVVMFFQAFSFLIIWLNNKKIKYFIPLLLTGGILIGLKVYIGLIFLIGLGFLGFYFLFKKDLKSCISFGFIFLLSLLIYLPINNGSGGLIFTGFWKTRDFIVNPNLGLSHLELARNIFQSAGNPKRYIFDFLFFIIFIVFSLGILIVGIFNSPKNLRKISISIHIFLVSGFVVSFILGMFFIQKTGGANSGQFLISTFLIGIIYASLFLDNLFQKHNKVVKLIVIILILSVFPKTIFLSLNKINTLNNHKYGVVEKDILDSFTFINNNIPQKSVFAVDPDFAMNCLHIDLLTNSKTYFCKAGAPADRGINSNSYEVYLDKVFAGNNKDIRFDYIFTKKQMILKDYTTLFENDSIKILKPN